MFRTRVSRRGPEGTPLRVSVKEEGAALSVVFARAATDAPWEPLYALYGVRRVPVPECFRADAAVLRALDSTS